MPKIKTANGIEDRKVVSQKEWLKARLDLLKAEKELTRRSDELARLRQALPWVRIENAGDDAPPTQNAAMTGTDVTTYTRARPGMSVFALEDGDVYHTYSAYARGVDVLWGMYQWLDRAPKGRNETGMWWRRHDEYHKR